MKKFILFFTMLTSFSAIAQTFSFGGSGAADEMVMTGTTVKYYVCNTMIYDSNCTEVASRPMDPSCRQIFATHPHGEQEFAQKFYCPTTSSLNPKCKYGFEVACGDARYQWAMNPWYRQMSQFNNQWMQPMPPWMMYGYNPYFMNNNNRQFGPMPFGGGQGGAATNTSGGPSFTFGT